MLLLSKVKILIKMIKVWCGLVVWNYWMSVFSRIVNNVDEMVLINNNEVLLWLILSMIKVLRFLVLIKVVKVVVLMIKMSVVWILVMICGRVMGSLILNNLCICDILKVLVVFLIEVLIFEIFK